MRFLPGGQQLLLKGNAMNSTRNVPMLIRMIYSITHELERLFPGRRFTPDGHLVGSIGEVLAANDYSLKLLKASTRLHDARAGDGRLVQIKATQVSTVRLRGRPRYLIVLLVHADGQHEEIYNGPGGRPWSRAGRIQSNGQRPISLAKLRELNENVNPKSRIRRKQG